MLWTILESKSEYQKPVDPLPPADEAGQRLDLLHEYARASSNNDEYLQINCVRLAILILLSLEQLQASPNLYTFLSSLYDLLIYFKYRFTTLTESDYGESMASL